MKIKPLQKRTNKTRGRRLAKRKEKRRRKRRVGGEDEEGRGRERR